MKLGKAEIYLLDDWAERPHQGLGNGLIRSSRPQGGAVQVAERLGGLLKFYYRQAA